MLDVGQDLSDADLELLLLGSQLVQFFDKLHIFLEYAIVLLSVLSRFFHQLFLQCFDIVLNLSALCVVNLVNVRRSGVVHSLIEHPSAIKSHNSFLELLVRQIRLEEHLLDVVSKLLHRVLLPLDFAFHLA